jgi:hypothetical protein
MAGEKKNCFTEFDNVIFLSNVLIYEAVLFLDRLGLDELDFIVFSAHKKSVKRTYIIIIYYILFWMRGELIYSAP